MHKDKLTAGWSRKFEENMKRIKGEECKKDSQKNKKQA